MPSSRKLGSLFLLSLLILSLIFTSIGFVKAPKAPPEEYVLVMVEEFGYEQREYKGSWGPGGAWHQHPEGGTVGTRYEIKDTPAGVAYEIASGERFAKSVYGWRSGYPYGGAEWEGPNDYRLTARMKVIEGYGGLIFRVQKVDGEPLVYNYVVVNKNEKTIKAGKVNERTGSVEEYVGGLLPESVDLDEFFTVSVIVQGYNVWIRVEGQGIGGFGGTEQVVSTGGFGLIAYDGRSQFEDFKVWEVLPEVEATTVTVTRTAVSTAAQTTTITETTTMPASTIIETVKVPTTVTQTVVERPKCLIATAAFGSELTPQVQALREFRDRFVMKTFAGSNFMVAFNAFYYSWSPYVAQAEYENSALRSFVRASIYPLLSILDFSKIAAEPFSTVPELSVLVAGLVAGFLIGLIYVAPLIIASAMILRWKGRQPSLNPLYPASALLAGLILFALAESALSPALMIISSSLIVLSDIALAATAPLKLFPAKR